MNIAEKIKKLLRLSKSPHPGEAELALQRAFEIAAKYQIDIDSLDLDEELSKIISDATRIGFRLSLKKRLAWQIINSFFNVKAIIRYPDMLLVGTSGDIEIARYVHDFIVRTVEQRVKYFTKISGSRFTERRKRSYINGFYYGLCAQLNKDRETLQIENQQLGMVLADQKVRREQFCADNVGPTKAVARRKEKRQDKDFLGLGYMDGKTLNIHTGCSSGSGTAAPLQLT